MVKRWFCNQIMCKISDNAGAATAAGAATTSLVGSSSSCLFSNFIALINEWAIWIGHALRYNARNHNLDYYFSVSAESWLLFRISSLRNDGILLFAIDQWADGYFTCISGPTRCWKFQSNGVLLHLYCARMSNHVHQRQNQYEPKVKFSWFFCFEIAKNSDKMCTITDRRIAAATDLPIFAVLRYFSRIFSVKIWFLVHTDFALDEIVLLTSRIYSAVVQLRRGYFRF